MRIEPNRAGQTPRALAAGHEFKPAIGIPDVFRELIAAELRAGRLSPTRRQRIVQYAAQLGLSAVEAGRLIAACRDEALESEDPQLRAQALRLAEPERRTHAVLWKLILASAIAVAAHAALR